MNVEFLLHIDLFDQLGCRKAEHALTPADLLSKCEKESDCQKEEEDVPFGRQRKDMVARSVPRVYDRKDQTADQETHGAERLKESVLTSEPPNCLDRESNQTQIGNCEYRYDNEEVGERCLLHVSPNVECASQHSKLI